MSETIVLRFKGGPWDGQTRIVEDDWPPRDEVDFFDEGVYRKQRQSQIPESMPGLVRGAEYEWTPR